MNDKGQNANQPNRDQDPFSNYITVEEAAAIIGVSRISGYIQRMCRQGRLKAIRFGTSWAIDRQSVENFSRRSDQGQDQGQDQG